MNSQSPSVWNSLLVLLLSLFILSCSLEQRSAESRERNKSAIPVSSSHKQRGAHVFGRIDSIDFQFLTQDHIEWVTLVPWGFQESINSSEVLHHRGDSARMKRRNTYWLRQIKAVRKAGFKVFVKPHIWMDTPPEGKWRSDIFPSDDEKWEQWKKTYRTFIFRYARLAEEAGVEMFCVGTELTRLTIEKPDYWKDLISEVREIYSGEVTYAANWYQEYEAITFWNELDYIGIQAYFPLVDHENPDVDAIIKGWSQYIPVLEGMHEKYNRRILFTELGYKSTPNSAMKPWEWMDHAHADEMAVSYETQTHCYEAFFKMVWSQPWFAGVHLWQYRQDHEVHADELIHDFTPQGKPAEEVITKGFNN